MPKWGKATRYITRCYLKKLLKNNSNSFAMRFWKKCQLCANWVSKSPSKKWQIPLTLKWGPFNIILVVREFFNSFHDFDSCFCKHLTNCSVRLQYCTFVFFLSLGLSYTLAIDILKRIRWTYFMLWTDICSSYDYENVSTEKKRIIFWILFFFQTFCEHLIVIAAVLFLLKPHYIGW